MKTLHILTIAAALSASFATAALAQDARHAPRYEDYLAIAPSAQGQVISPRGFETAPFAPSATGFSDQDAQRIRGDRW